MKDKKVNMILKGELDWDLYENGILCRYYSDTAIDNIEKKFIFYSEISKIYFNITKDEYSKLLKLIKEYDRIKCTDWKETDYVLNESWKREFKQYIWFEGKDGTLFENDLFKNRVRDLKRLESILRQKVKEVI